jgi:hypothetical protein
MRALFATLAAAVTLLVPGVRAGAATAEATVTKVDTPPAIDAQAPVAGWPAEPALTLPWDVVHVHPADEPTAVHVASDGTFLYVRFDAGQREPIVATQHSNDTIAGGSNGNGGALAWSADDAVWVDLWPNGATGFEYQFEANPNGSHNESSSENSAFAPQWESHGTLHDGGYTVTMAIPIGVIHGAHTGTWRAQFIRYVRATGVESVWSFDASQTNPDDVSRAGALTVTVAGKAQLPKPRAAIYGLGSVASAAAGGSTSRVGGDVSVPVTPTAAVFAAFHPDYSNVELDQQSISPTVYQRQFSEVRPFFTQAASYYNNFNCAVCNGYRTTLYTPAIPTFAQGYAFEGKQGNFGFAGFDAARDHDHHYKQWPPRFTRIRYWPENTPKRAHVLPLLRASVRCRYLHGKRSFKLRLIRAMMSFTSKPRGRLLTLVGSVVPGSLCGCASRRSFATPAEEMFSLLFQPYDQLTPRG